MHRINHSSIINQHGQNDPRNNQGKISEKDLKIKAKEPLPLQRRGEE